MKIHMDMSSFRANRNFYRLLKFTTFLNKDNGTDMFIKETKIESIITYEKFVTICLNATDDARMSCIYNIIEELEDILLDKIPDVASVQFTDYVLFETVIDTFLDDIDDLEEIIGEIRSIIWTSDDTALTDMEN